VTGRDHPGVTPACLHRDTRLSLEQGNFMPIPLQLTGAGHSDDAATQDENSLSVRALVFPLMRRRIEVVDHRDEIENR
jgi:hypothetical protein